VDEPLPEGGAALWWRSCSPYALVEELRSGITVKYGRIGKTKLNF